MPEIQPPRMELLLGTLDILILRTLAKGCAHGHAIARHIRLTSEESFKWKPVRFYPVPHRPEAKGWVGASWELSEKGKLARYYRLTALGKKHLGLEQSRWEMFSSARGLVLGTAPRRRRPSERVLP